MIRASYRPSIWKRILPVCGSILAALTIRAQDIVYNNISSYLEQYETDTREYGDQIHLGGEARVVTQFAFRYFGDFTSSGDQRAQIRFYANDRPYDQWRQQPGTVLWESGYFPIDAGVQLKVLNVTTPGSAVEVPDIFTFTVEFLGLADNEAAGLLIYGPPTVGSSFNEFWMRTGENRFVPVQYPGGEPRANFYAQVLAVPEPGTLALLAGGMTLLCLRRKRAGRAHSPE